METLAIDRSKWLTGRTESISHLQNSDGDMCCLGFYCEVDYPEYMLLDRDYPSNIANEIITEIRERGDYTHEISDRLRKMLKPDATSARDWDDIEVVDQLIRVNDDRHLSDGKREWGVMWRFATIGVYVIFEGEYPEGRLPEDDRHL